MNKPSDLHNSIIFSKGEQIMNSPFTGAVWLNMLVPKDNALIAL
jgi:hypothetical protein